MSSSYTCIRPHCHSRSLCVLFLVLSTAIEGTGDYLYCNFVSFFRRLSFMSIISCLAHTTPTHRDHAVFLPRLPTFARCPTLSVSILYIARMHVKKCYSVSVF
ncbi:hypothetical protein BDN67DRAFT_244122 [Paxillus ammoniavirescens]|nr:hypothetical protein BDN67DRAFT_244122 [Paxillus ammoniavirescens]